MGYQIIKERTAESFALFSSVTSDFVLRAATQQEIVEFFVEQETARIRESVASIIDVLNVGRKPYHQFTMSIEEAEEESRTHNDQQGEVG